MSYLKNLTETQRADLREKAAAAKKIKSESNKLKRFQTLRAAVDAHCRGCIYDPEAGGTWLQQVTDCQVTKCEMHEWRPLSKVGGDGKA